VTRQSDVSAALLQATPAVGILLELTCVSEACALIAGKLGDFANALAERSPLPLASSEQSWGSPVRSEHAGRRTAACVSIPTYSVDREPRGSSGNGQAPGDTWAVEVPRVAAWRGAKREAGVKPELPPQL
jgi:hypothetical protein